MSEQVSSLPGSIGGDTAELHRLGYAQELKRSMSKFSNFAISFTIISILSGCLTLYYFGLDHGGPPVMIWGWLIVGILVLFAGMSMAEICSSYPTAGGGQVGSGPERSDLVVVHGVVQSPRSSGGYCRY